MDEAVVVVAVHGTLPPHHHHGMVWHALGTHTTHTRGAPTKGVQGRRGRAAVCVVGRHGGVERGQHAAREPPPPPH